MRISCALTLVGTAIALGGCASRGNVDLLEAELRRQEDQLHSLQVELGQTHNALLTAQRETQLLQQQFASSPETRTVLLPEQIATLAKADALRINTMFSGGLDRDGQPGDDEVAILLTPHDADGSLVKLTGDIEFELLDLSAGQSQRSLGQYAFTQAQMQQRWHAGLTEGYLFRLPMKRRPQTKEIVVAARMQAVDGRVFAANDKLAVTPGDSAPGNTPSSAARRMVPVPPPELVSPPLPAPGNSRAAVPSAPPATLPWLNAPTATPAAAVQTAVVETGFDPVPQADESQPVHESPLLFVLTAPDSGDTRRDETPTEIPEETPPAASVIRTTSGETSTTKVFWPNATPQPGPASRAVEHVSWPTEFLEESPAPAEEQSDEIRSAGTAVANTEILPAAWTDPVDLLPTDREPANVETTEPESANPEPAMPRPMQAPVSAVLPSPETPLSPESNPFEVVDTTQGKSQVLPEGILDIRDVPESPSEPEQLQESQPAPLLVDLQPGAGKGRAKVVTPQLSDSPPPSQHVQPPSQTNPPTQPAPGNDKSSSGWLPAGARRRTTPATATAEPPLFRGPSGRAIPAPWQLPKRE